MSKGRLSSNQVWINGFIFVAAMWLISRLVIVAVMLLLAPSLPAPPGGVVPTVGWGVFSYWDSGYYLQIATSGYEYVNDGRQHNIAFFPLFPLFIRGVMTLGLPVEVAGILVNNLAFLGALMVLYCWVAEHHGRSAARWATATLAWCPLSIYGTVIYSEGLFLLFSTAALRAFDQKQYARAALWGALTTAARPTGIALVPAFLIASWRERRSVIAYVASLAVGGGLLLYSLYCEIHFGDIMAFSHAQQGWGRSIGINWLGWLKILMQITVGTTNWKHGSIKDPWHPLLFLTIVGSGYLLWRYGRSGWQNRSHNVKVGDGFCALGLCLWLLTGDPLINGVMIFGGSYLLWYSRAQLSPVTVIYGFCALGLIFVSGSTWSLDRFAFGIVSLAIALGLLLARYPRYGYAVISFFAILLASFAIRFSQHLWVG